MNSDYNDTNIDKNICEAMGCSASATDKIAVKVGTLGVISLLVCSDCIVKFQDETVGPKASQDKEVESFV